MTSERTRKILPYVSIGIGILVYVLYYYSTQSWKQAQSDYERQQIEERQAKQRADNKLVEDAKPWISEDGSEIYKIINREEKNGLTWIKLKELRNDVTYNLKHVVSASGEKYTSNAGNMFWAKGNEAIFENKEKVTKNLRSIKTFKGLFSYLADANIFKICDSDRKLSVAFLGDNINIEKAYSKINRPGEDVYLEIDGSIIQVMGPEGDQMVEAIYPYKFINIEDRTTCE